jgi:hypothetical protein
MTDQELITALTLSCRRQLEMYRRLLDTAQGILGRLAVSRGDLSALTPAFRQKQEILDAIAADRLDSTPLVTLWQERKEAARAACAATDLDTALAETESVIKRFLDNEEQIKRYLERAVKGRDAADHGN